MIYGLECIRGSGANIETGTRVLVDSESSAARICTNPWRSSRVRPLSASVRRDAVLRELAGGSRLQEDKYARTKAPGKPTEAVSGLTGKKSSCAESRSRRRRCDGDSVDDERPDLRAEGEIVGAGDDRDQWRGIDLTPLRCVDGCRH